MKVILVSDVKSLGNKGEVVEVSQGYARNYLLPHGLAVEATAGNLKDVERKKDQEKQKKENELAAAREAGRKIDGAIITVTSKAGEGGKLFGSVTNKEVAEVMARDLKITVDKRKIELKEPIKALGMYSISVKLHPKVQVTVQVQVVAG
ncbi:MAG: 50S ribosomal protein L9 [Bacillota bacterium]